MSQCKSDNLSDTFKTPRKLFISNVLFGNKCAPPGQSSVSS
jgi:hypothetical protein